MRGDTQFGLLVHVEGADLHLQGLVLGTHHGGVQALVAVALGARDVVVELAGNGLPEAVHQAQYVEAVLDVAHQHAQGTHVVDLVEGQALLAHLRQDAGDVLGAAADGVAAEAFAVKDRAQLAHDLVDVPLPVQAAFVQQPGDLPVGFRFEVAAGKVLQFPLQLPDAQTVGQGGIEFAHVGGDLATQAFVAVGQLAQGLGAFRQLDEHHADVVGHGQQHLAQGLALAALDVELRDQVVQPREFGRALHQAGEMRAETGEQGVAPYVLFRQAAEQGGRHGFRVETHSGEQRGGTQAVFEQRAAGIHGLLPTVRGQPVGGLLQQLALFLGIAVGKTGEPGFRVTVGEGEGVGNHSAGQAQDARSKTQDSRCKAESHA